MIAMCEVDCGELPQDGEYVEQDEHEMTNMSAYPPSVVKGAIHGMSKDKIVDSAFEDIRCPLKELEEMIELCIPHEDGCINIEELIHMLQCVNLPTVRRGITELAHQLDSAEDKERHYFEAIEGLTERVAAKLDSLENNNFFRATVFARNLLPSVPTCDEPRMRANSTFVDSIADGADEDFGLCNADRSHPEDAPVTLGEDSALSKDVHLHADEGFSGSIVGSFALCGGGRSSPEVVATLGGDHDLMVITATPWANGH